MDTCAPSDPRVETRQSGKPESTVSRETKSSSDCGQASRRVEKKPRQIIAEDGARRMGAGGIVGYRKASRVSIHAMVDRKVTSGFRPERRIPSSTFAGNRSRTEIPDRIGHECGTGGGTGRLKEQLGIEFADDREVLPQPGGFGLARSRKRKAGPVRLGKSSVFSTMMCAGL